MSPLRCTAPLPQVPASPVAPHAMRDGKISGTNQAKAFAPRPQIEGLGHAFLACGSRIARVDMKVGNKHRRTSIPRIRDSLYYKTAFHKCLPTKARGGNDWIMDQNRYNSAIGRNGAKIKLLTLILVSLSRFRAMATINREPTQVISLMTGVVRKPEIACADTVSSAS